MHPLAVHGQSLYELQPVRKNFGRICKQWKAGLKIRDFLRSSLATPAKTVGRHRPSGHRPELDEILRSEIDFIALGNQPGKGIGCDGVL